MMDVPLKWFLFYSCCKRPFRKLWSGPWKKKKVLLGVLTSCVMPSAVKICKDPSSDKDIVLLPRDICSSQPFSIVQRLLAARLFVSQVAYGSAVAVMVWIQLHIWLFLPPSVRLGCKQQDNSQWIQPSLPQKGLIFQLTLQISMKLLGRRRCYWRVGCDCFLCIVIAEVWGSKWAVIFDAYVTPTCTVCLSGRWGIILDMTDKSADNKEKGVEICRIHS